MSLKLKLNNKRLGFTFIEMLVTLTILSILASIALPYSHLVITRNKEYELRSVLRGVRNAIDEFHQDWKFGKVSRLDDAASEDGYPVSLMILVEGVEKNGIQGGMKRYLRRLPRDPFASEDLSLEEHWKIRGYQDDVDSLLWSGSDVYDIHSQSEKQALDGTHYNEW